MTTSDPKTMKLADVLANYRDGDEHGWDTEFALLRRDRAGYLDMLATSIQETGMNTPILLGNDGRVWNGHHRLCVASMLGLEEVPVEHATSDPTPGEALAQYDSVKVAGLRTSPSEDMLATALRTEQSARQAAEARIDAAQIQVDACRSMVDEHLVIGDAAAVLSMAVRGLDAVLTAPTESKEPDRHER